MSQKQDNYANFFQALIKARSKNQMEDIKLQKSLKDLEVVKRHNDRVIFNEIYEQKREAYRLNFENKEVQKRKHESDNASRRAKAKANYKHVPKLDDIEEDGDGGVTKKSKTETLAGDVLPRVGRLTREGSDMSLPDHINAKPGGLQRADTLPSLSRRSSKDFDLSLGASASDTKVDLREALRLVPITEETSKAQQRVKRSRAKPQPSDTSDPFPNVIDKMLGTPLEERQKEETPRDRKDSVVSSVTHSQGPYPIFRSNTMPDINSHPRYDSSLNIPASVPKDKEEKPAGKLPGLGGRSHTVVDLKQVWVGDPKAIGSVRRPRMDIDDMTARNKAVGDLRKLLRDMPSYPSCSRNCNRPGAEFESMVSDLTPLPASKIKADLKKEMKEKADKIKHLDMDQRERDAQVKNIENLSFAAAMMLVKKIRQRSKGRQSLVPTTRELHKAVQEATHGKLKTMETVGHDVNKSMKVTTGLVMEPAARPRRPSRLEIDIALI